MLSHMLTLLSCLLGSTAGALLMRAPSVPRSYVRMAVELSAADSIAETASDAVLKATLGIDRGVAASAADAERIEAAIATFETVSPCVLDGSDLTSYLDGEWKLVYSSTLVERSNSGADDIRRFAATIVDVPTARSRVALGDVSQYISGSTMEERIALRLRTPWPLPAAPDLKLRIASTLEPGAAIGEVRAVVQEVSVQGVLGGASATSLPAAKLPAGRVREALEGVLAQLGAAGSTLQELPPSKELRDIAAGSEALALTATSELVRVSRSGLGEVRVFMRTSGVASGDAGPMRAAVASAAATSASANSTSAGNASAAIVLGPQALREVARVREEVEAAAAATLAAELAAAAALAAEEKRAIQAQLEDSFARLSQEAAEAAQAELEQASELFEAKVGAAAAVAAAELADAMSQSEETLAAAKAAAADERDSLSKEHAAQLAAVTDKAAAEVAEAQRALDMALVRAEEEMAQARSAFLAEKQQLAAKLFEAEAAAEKAKKAAIAAIGDL